MTLLATLSSIFRSRAALELENLALGLQIGVLRRAAAKRLKLTSADRLLWICLSRLWPGWHSALTIVKPETVVAWHRAGFRLDLKGALRPTRTTHHFARGPSADPQDVQGKPLLGCTPHPWRAPQTRHQRRRAVSANTWCAPANHRLKPGAHSSRFTPSNWVAVGTSVA